MAGTKDETKEFGLLSSFSPICDPSNIVTFGHEVAVLHGKRRKDPNDPSKELPDTEYKLNRRIRDIDFRLFCVRIEKTNKLSQRLRLQTNWTQDFGFLFFLSAHFDHTIQFLVILNGW